jgi:small nuclear ribonucleoprotein D3
MADEQSSIGVPLRILHDALECVVTVELSTMDTYRGKLTEIQDNMNIELTDVTHTLRNGTSRTIPRVFIRGSLIVFFVLPETLKYSPEVLVANVKKPVDAGKGGQKGFGAGRFGSKRGREE